MQNPGGNHPAPAAAAAGKFKSSAQGAVVASGHGHQPSPATPAAAKSRSSGHCHHSSPSMPVVGKSKPSAHAVAPGQASTSHQPHPVGVGDAAASSLKRKRSVFQKDLQHMMYGFGDDPNPLPETVALVEDIVVEYITDLVHKAENVASKRGKLLTEDFLYLIRKDMRKLHRSTELLSMNEELKQARKAFDVNEETLVVTNE
ncbi:transcription initiation factor TFIID subunit 13 [Aegilops tauschii subsp. strangulata]|uniref:Transcription initiation factor TFIID subunit 13 n=2 Tax=Aegilops tauschii TaxID=37682 RepID=A0A453KDJ7_AEGTS|nr:transcription initiation factor TFIID subunit 13 [Aegilops tauschii subsp. strangulata]